MSDPSDKQATRVEEGQTPKKRKEQEVQDEGVPRETSSDDDDEGEEEGDEDDGYDSAEDCWRCRDDMCFKHALRGIKGAKVTEVVYYTISQSWISNIPCAIRFLVH